MATSELEDLAAAVGIEILSDDGDISGPQCAAAVGEQTENENEKAVEPTIFPPDILSLCSEDHLKELEAEFADRYTSTDKEYTHTVETATLPPPCVTGWWSADRNFDRSRDRRGGRGHWGRGRGHWGGGDSRDRGDYQHSNRYHDHRQDRYRDNQGHHHQRDREHRHHRDRSPDRRYR